MTDPADLFPRRDGKQRVPRPKNRLNDAQRLAWLRLIRSQNIGPVTFRELLNRFGGAQLALEALPELARRGGRKNPLLIYPEADAQRELAAAKKLKAQLLALGEPGYPVWLSEMPAPPPLIYVKGQISLFDKPMIAIVGSRNASVLNRKFAETLANKLGQLGYVVVSGLARGIDTHAHQGALDKGTVAVLAGGIDVVYPPQNASLYKSITERGVVVSEMPPGFKPRAQEFPRRNRIISGLSAGVVVVEAAKRSGSLITARLAGEQGREVFAVPGHPTDPRAVGTNGLIKNGAGFITCAEDIDLILQPVLGHFAGGRQDPTPNSFAEPENEITTFEPPANLHGDPPTDALNQVAMALGPSPVSIDTLIRVTGLASWDVNSALMELDIAGRLSRPGAQQVALCEDIKSG